MCFVQLRCDSSESATILNERNQSLEREKNFSSLVYVLKKNFTSGNFVSQTRSDGKEIPSRKEVQSDGLPLKPIA